MWVPHSVEKHGHTAIMQYGHGLFSTRYEGGAHYLQKLASDNRYVMVAAEWWGLSQRDIKAIGMVVARDLSKFNAIPDRSSQGVFN